MTFLKTLKKSNEKITLVKLSKQMLEKQIQASTLFTDGMNICFLDLETTGLDKNNNKIIEIALKGVKIDQSNGSILSFYDAKKGQFDDAFSNAFGSNIFDICIGLGLPVFIYTLLNGDILLNNDSKFSSELLIISLFLLLILSIAIGILFSIGKYNKKKISITLLLYMLFIFFLMSL